MLNEIELKYIISFIIEIAFPKIKYVINSNTVIINKKQIEFRMMNEFDYKKLINGEFKFEYIYNYNKTFKIPVTDSKFIFEEKEKIIINSDIITLPFLLLSRKEELVIGTRDEKDRYRFEGSLSDKYNLIDFPLIDEYAMLLRKKLIDILKIRIEPNKGKLIVSHDIDKMFRFGNFKQNLKTIIGGDLISRKSIFLFLKSLKNLISTKKNNMNDEKVQAILDFINFETIHNIESYYFFLSYDKKDSDYRYDIYDKRVEKIISIIKSKNKNIGIHAGLNAFNQNCFYQQLNKLKKYGSIKFNRNHYLLFNNENTIKILEQNKIQYDFSVGYPERVGFKSGTCHEYKLFDLKENRVTNIIERPLIVMDGPLKDEMNLSINESYEKVKKLYNICMSTEGNFIILWHPDSAIREWKKWYKDVYLKFLMEVV